MQGTINYPEKSDNMQASADVLCMRGAGFQYYRGGNGEVSIRANQCCTGELDVVIVHMGDLY